MFRSRGEYCVYVRDARSVNSVHALRSLTDLLSGFAHCIQSGYRGAQISQEFCRVLIDSFRGSVGRRVHVCSCCVVLMSRLLLMCDDALVSGRLPPGFVEESSTYSMCKLKVYVTIRYMYLLQNYHHQIVSQPSVPSHDYLCVCVAITLEIYSLNNFHVFKQYHYNSFLA